MSYCNGFLYASFTQFWCPYVQRIEFIIFEFLECQIENFIKSKELRKKEMNK